MNINRIYSNKKEKKCQLQIGYINIEYLEKFIYLRAAFLQDRKCGTKIRTRIRLRNGAFQNIICAEKQETVVRNKVKSGGLLSDFYLLLWQ